MCLCSCTPCEGIHAQVTSQRGGEGERGRGGEGGRGRGEGRGERGHTEHGKFVRARTTRGFRHLGIMVQRYGTDVDLCSEDLGSH